MQPDAVTEMVDPVELFGLRASDHPVYLVPLLQQPFSQVRTVLARNSGDQSSAFAHMRGTIAGGVLTVLPLASGGS